MKDQLQQELKVKVKPGVKPSDLRKLKRSKSEGDIPKAPPLPTSVSEPTLLKLQEQVKFHAQTAANYLKSLQQTQVKVSELEGKLKSFNQLELDNSLLARHKSLKDWFSQYQKNKQLDKELKENIDEASEELIGQDKTINQLRGEITKLKLTNHSLQKDLASLRKDYLPESNFDYSHLLVCAFLVLWFITLLNDFWKTNFKNHG